MDALQADERLFPRRTFQFKIRQRKCSICDVHVARCGGLFQFLRGVFEEYACPSLNLDLSGLLSFHVQKYQLWGSAGGHQSVLFLRGLFLKAALRCRWNSAAR